MVPCLHEVVALLSVRSGAGQVSETEALDPASLYACLTNPHFCVCGSPEEL